MTAAPWCRGVRILTLALLIPSAPAAFGAGDATRALDLARQLNEAFVAVAEKVSPSVVIIDIVQAEEESEGNPAWLNLFPEELRERYKEEMERRRQDPHQRPRQRPGDEFNGQGSGMIISKDGDVLTNNHVVEGAKRLRVRLRDGRQFEVEVKGTDSDSDLAVIRIKDAPKDLPVVTFADSDRVRVGEFAIAIGAPYRLDYSVSFGHVSAKGRSDIIGGMFDQDFLQTDANINPGNSGGPLVDIEGRVIGINSMIRGLNSGIGFAIPSNLAREIAGRLVEDGRFVRSWLGLQIEALRDLEEVREQVPDLRGGVVVGGIAKKGPASRAEPSLKRMDVITAVDGHPVADPAQLRAIISRKRPGSTVTLDVRRAEASLKVRVSPEALPAAEDRMAVFSGRRSSVVEEPTSYGLEVSPLPEAAARNNRVDAGVLVAEVAAGSEAAEADLHPGDVITQVNHQPVPSPAQFQEVLGAAKLTDGILLQVVRDGSPGFRVLSPKK